MARGLVVEGEGLRGSAGSGVTPISMRPGAKLIQSSGGAMPGPGCQARRWLEAVGGVERVGEEGVLDVGGDEFQVLLLVLEAEDDAADGFVVDAGAGGASEERAMAASTWAR